MLQLAPSFLVPVGAEGHKVTTFGNEESSAPANDRGPQQLHNHADQMHNAVVAGRIQQAAQRPHGNDRDEAIQDSAMVQVRVNQSFFRRAVLASYQGRCCMSGVNHPRLLVASHIVPWSQDVANRLNPRNGLCLSALHDRAFDSGLISLNNDYQVIISDKLKHKADAFTEMNLLSL